MTCLGECMVANSLSQNMGENGPDIAHQGSNGPIVCRSYLAGQPKPRATRALVACGGLLLCGAFAVLLGMFNDDHHFRSSSLAATLSTPIHYHPFLTNINHLLSLCTIEIDLSLSLPPFAHFILI